VAGASGIANSGILGGDGGGGGQGMSAGGMAPLMAMLMREQSQQRKAQEEAYNYRNQLLGRNLGLAEGVYAGKQPLRDLGFSGVSNFFQGGPGTAHRGLFQTPSTPGSLTPNVGTPLPITPGPGFNLLPPVGGTPLPQGPRTERPPQPWEPRGGGGGGRASDDEEERAE
jgi:hypothetical protein